MCCFWVFMFGFNLFNFVVGSSIGNNSYDDLVELMIYSLFDLVVVLV